MAVQQLGALKKYVTGIFFNPAGTLGRSIDRLPTRLRASIAREVYRRHRPGLDPARVSTVPTLEVMLLLANRLRLPGKWRGKLWQRRDQWFDAAVARLVEREKPQMLICHNNSSLRSLRQARSQGTFSILCQAIGHIDVGRKILEEEAARHPEFAGNARRVSVDWLVDRCKEEASLADLVLAGSDYVKNSLLAAGVEPSHIVVIPYGVDTARFRPSLRHRDGQFRALFVGLIGQRKGVQYLLEAVCQLDLPNLELLLVGPIDNLGSGLAPYRGRFRHVAGVPHSEVQALFQSADVFVFPSLHEGSALVIYEALASGLPVITTPNSGSVVRDGVDGFIVPARDVRMLKEKIAALYGNRDLCAAMSRQARSRAEDFTWEKFRQKVGAVVRARLAVS